MKNILKQLWFNNLPNDEEDNDKFIDNNIYNINNYNYEEEETPMKLIRHKNIKKKIKIISIIIKIQQTQIQIIIKFLYYNIIII